LDVALSEKLQELDIEEIQEDEKDEAPELVEKPRTWEPVDVEKVVEKGRYYFVLCLIKIGFLSLCNYFFQEPEPEVIGKLPTKYVAPSRRIDLQKSDQPNLQDSEQFPTLGAAVDISKKEIEKRKLK